MAHLWPPSFATTCPPPRDTSMAVSIRKKHSRRIQDATYEAVFKPESKCIYRISDLWEKDGKKIITCREFGYKHQMSFKTNMCFGPKSTLQLHSASSSPPFVVALTSVWFLCCQRCLKHTAPHAKDVLSTILARLDYHRALLYDS